MELLEALALPPEGWTCLVGGGGKSSLMLRLVRERIGRGLTALAATPTPMPAFTICRNPAPCLP